MADLAKELLRTTVRAFYLTEQILVIDALCLHSTLPEQDLATVCGTQPKALRKLCGKLKEDGLLSAQTRAERRADGTGGYYGGGPQQGKERFTNKDWYYLNYHHAIDSIKFKMYRLNKHFESIGMPTTERKDQICPRCKSQYTDLEAMDHLDETTGTFHCKRCNHELERVEEEERANENESMKRLNQQMEKLLQLMQKIDAATVPENDFPTALENYVPLERSDANPGAKVEVIDMPNRNLQSTKGLEIKPEKISVQVQDDEDVKRERAEAEAKEKRERDAKQNQLPVWVSRSTISDDITAVGAKEAFERQQRQAHSTIVNKDDAEEKKPTAPDDDVMAQYWKELEREKAAEKAREAEEEDEEDEEEDEDGFEDIDVTTGGNARTNGTNGTTAVSTGMNTPLHAESSNATDDERATKRVRIEEPSSKETNGASHADEVAADTPAASDEDEDDDLEFENV